MKKIHVIATFKIHKGKLEAFKNLAKVCIARVKENEEGKGALQYDWFFNPDQTECVVRETYADSNAVLAHMGNVGEQLGQLLSMSDFSLEVYGNMSDELRQAAAALNPKIYSFYAGI